jgi:AcrR family transcriptional regulator
VNVATLAYQFGSKQGLYDALVDRTYGRLLEVDVTGGLPDDREARVRALVARLYAFARAHAVEVRVLVRHALDFGRVPAPEARRALLLVRAAEVLTALGLSPGPEQILVLQSLQHLVVRYALAGEEELVALGTHHAGVGEHLAELAVAVLVRAGKGG